ncbi:putative zinc-finger-containing protein [Amylocystis lapponica]|nr:putative zinc-finger-containing protein [Amylocystis lapponica]
MSEVVYADMTYCSLCDRYFPGDEARSEHVQHSPNHPKCDRCDRRFANKNSLRNHWVSSPRHHYCVVCEKDFRTAAGFRVHIEYAAVHRDDSDDDSEDDDGLDDSREGWEDDMGQTAFPEENERADDENSGDDDNSSEQDDYWDEDDETELEEEREAYYGFAPVSRQQVLNRVDSPNSAGGSDSEDENLSVADASVCHYGIHRTCDSRTEKAVQCGQAKAPSSGLLLNCPLCLEPAQDISSTRCGHLFCTSCITHSLANKKLCPVCRKSAVPRQLRKIYLS